MVAHYDQLVGLRYHIRELVLGIEVVLQSVYLTRTQATYSEAFYNFKRSQVRAKTLKELSRRLVCLSVFMEAIVPYLQEKLEQKDAMWSRWLVRSAKLLRFVYAFSFLVTNSRFFKPY
jgi:hypothetical protein